MQRIDYFHIISTDVVSTGPGAFSVRVGAAIDPVTLRQGTVELISVRPKRVN